MAKTTAKNVKKTSVFFPLDDVLVPGPVNPKLPVQKVHSVLSFLSGLEKEGLLTIYLVAGQKKGVAGRKLSKHGIDKFFRKDHIFFVNDEYINSKEELDRERHLASLEKDPDFVDEFFKQRIIMDLIASGKTTREETALICHDIWLDGFYTSRFSGVDFFLLEESLAERSRPIPGKINGLSYVKLREEDMRKVILGKFPEQDLRYLQAYVFNKLKLELFEDTKIGGLVRRSILSQQAKKKPN